MDLLESPWFLSLAGLLAGAVLGFAARSHHFCTLSALERHWYAGDSTGLRTWVMAAAVAMAATQLLAFAGSADISSSFYLSPLFGWTGAILGGFAFGIGMALVGTCGFGAAVRLGGGSLRGLIVLIVLGLSALSAQKGLIAQARVHVVDNRAIDLSFAGDQSLGSIASTFAGLDLRLPIGLAIAALLAAWVLRDRRWRANRAHLWTAAAVGGAVSFGWLATTLASRHAFQPVQIETASYVVPVGDTLLQFVTYTGVLPDYGVGLLIGTIAGAALAAWRGGDIRWEACDDARELGRHLAGAFLMGVGGVFAMGCTIGQGISAASALAISAPVVMLSIAAGARVGLAWLLEGSLGSLWPARGSSRSPAE